MKLEVKNGCFGYGNCSILKNINFSLNDNTIMTILGPNGVGKTTLLKCIMGFHKWRHGKTLMDGKPVAGCIDKEFWKRTSYVPQAKQSAFSYKVTDVVMMGLNARQKFFATPKKQDIEKAEAMLEHMGVIALKNKYCNELSGGELQMVMMARALVSEPELLILDEPESNLDMRNQLQVINAIERVANEFKTSCLINTHFPNHALKISDTTLMLSYNNKQILGNTLDIVTEKNIREYFDVKSRIIELEVNKQQYHTIFPYQICG